VRRGLASLQVAIMFTAFSWSVDLRANTCTAPPPLKLSGPLCGRVMDVSGATVPDVELRVLDATESVVAQIRADSQGSFRFPPVAKGKYHLTTTAQGCFSYVGQIELTSDKKKTCRRPVSVYRTTSSCSGGINKDKPPHYHASGLQG
jgi:Carboxypeptidase regulatory-like domain